MKSSTFKLFTGLISLSILLALGPIASPAAEKPAAGPADQLLTLGKIGPNAVDLKVRTENPRSKTFAKGEPVTVRLRPSAKVYLTAVYVSAGGDVMVLFPNKHVPDNLVQPDKEFTLFDSRSKVKLRAQPGGTPGKLVLFAGPKQIKLDAFKIPEGGSFITIPASAADDFSALMKLLEEMSKEQGFNRTEVSLATAVKPVANLKLLGLPPRKSKKPGSAAGSQGVSPDPVDSERK